MAYENTQPVTEGLLPENPKGKIIRALALDALTHLAYRGKYISWMAYPDRWGRTWIPAATMLGKRHVEKYPPDIIWSSSPTPSPHVIARSLQEKTGAKWIADYRDPMTHLQRKLPDTMGKMLQKIDAATVTYADILTFATEEVAQMYRERAPLRSEHYFKTMQNGYDAHLLEKVKLSLEHNVSNVMKKETYNIYYAGVLYSEGRDPCPLFEAIAEMKKTHPSCPIKLIFQGTKNADDYTDIIHELDIETSVEFLPGVPFEEAIVNMLHADALLLIQDARFNKQIPGKVYEYLATEKTMLLKSPKESATSKVACEFDGVYQINEKASIYGTLCDIVEPFFEQNAHMTWPRTESEWSRDTDKHSRQHHVKGLLAWSNQLPPRRNQLF